MTIRLPNEPDCLHPFFSKSSYATQIESQILLPVAEFDPVSLKLSPLLIEEIPAAEMLTSGQHAHGQVYRLKFRKEATWSDGKPVTGEDYLFTVKSVYNPNFNLQSWKAYFDFISAIEVDPADPKLVSVYIDSSYFLSLETVVNFNVYPAHQYDPEGIMAQFSLEDLRNPEMNWSAAQDTLLKQFAASFESPHFFREMVTGAGAYELDNWTTGEFIRLKRKTNWWGDKINPAPLLLQAYPDVITYRIILDAVAAETALKAGEVDVLAEVPATDFVALQHDPAWQDKLQFATPPLLQVYYLELNNRDSILADKRIRQALARTIDYDGLLDQILKGLAQRTIGPFHPNKVYYDKDLIPVKQDIQSALTLIADAGWKDTNGNGIPDKRIGGKTQELQIHIKIPNKAEGNAIANIVKENARKAGIDIVIDAVDPGQWNQDIRQLHFEVATARFSTYPTNDDPFSNWHSSSDRPGGNNRSGYHTAELDSVIETIQSAETEDVRNAAYQKFQEIIYRDQPSIWLYVPLERIIASKRIEVTTSSRRPGYFENLIRLAG